MQIIKIILSVIFIIDCIALTVVVLMQEVEKKLFLLFVFRKDIVNLFHCSV